MATPLLYAATLAVAASSLLDFPGPPPPIFHSEHCCRVAECEHATPALLLLCSVDGNFVVSIRDGPVPDAVLASVSTGEVSRRDMTAAHGDSFACYLPVPGKDVVPKEATTAALRLSKLKSLFSDEDRPCVGRRFDFWTYEMCPGRTARQFHLDDAGAVQIEFGLGSHVASEDAVVTLVRRGAASSRCAHRTFSSLSTDCPSQVDGSLALEQVGI